MWLLFPRRGAFQISVFSPLIWFYSNKWIWNTSVKERMLKEVHTCTRQSFLARDNSASEIFRAATRKRLFINLRARICIDFGAHACPALLFYATLSQSLFLKGTECSVYHQRQNWGGLGRVGWSLANAFKLLQLQLPFPIHQTRDMKNTLDFDEPMLSSFQTKLDKLSILMGENGTLSNGICSSSY